MTLTLEDYRHAVEARRIAGNTYNANSIVTYEYWAKVKKIVDGDTIDLSVSLGFDCYIDKRCRLFGVDTPEIFSSRADSPERAAGVAAKAFLDELIPVGSWIEIRVFSDSPHDKYGRWLIEIFDDGTNINEALVSNNHAVFYIP